MTSIDAHQHFWSVVRGDYGWLDAHPEINRDYLPNDLRPLLKSCDVEKTILVQAAPTEQETRFLLNVAGRTNFVVGVVGWVDFDARDVAEKVEILAENERLVGLRPMIQDLSDQEWMLSPHLASAFEAMIDAGLRFDALVKPQHLKTLAKFLMRWPALRVVIDHGAKPFIGAAEIDPWAGDMRVLAKESGAVCKLSGLATEAAKDWNEATLKPYVDVLLDAFGPSRLMWGSDWPVVNEAGGYRRWHAAARQLTDQLSASDRESVFGGTACTFYGVEQ